MASSSELATVSILTRQGVMKAVVLDRVGPDRIYLMLLRGAIAAQYGRDTDRTPLVSRAIKDLLINPVAE